MHAMKTYWKLCIFRMFSVHHSVWSFFLHTPNSLRGQRADKFFSYATKPIQFLQVESINYMTNNILAKLPCRESGIEKERKTMFKEENEKNRTQTHCLYWKMLISVACEFFFLCFLFQLLFHFLLSSKLMVSKKCGPKSQKQYTIRQL